ncbi:hypothetical protein [Sphingomonas sp. Leaf4]|uniref:hypothetical protein n=1 Tax=Sphingomonas sp. Leaf4 TaxID=2876553 RepID=UPI001E2F857B|nr:hypothetical protein [Sphingomonas sp. Leaf4]
MEQRNNADYYRRRIIEARARADGAFLPEVRVVHTEMAERYAQLLAEVEHGDRPRLGIVSRS